MQCAVNDFSRVYEQNVKHIGQLAYLLSFRD